MHPDDIETFIEDLAEQAADLAGIQDHIVRVIANLDIDTDGFAGYDHPEKARFDLAPMIRTLLYMYTRNLSQNEVERRMKGATYIYLRFDLRRPPQQEDISYNKRHRFTLSERQALQTAADRIRSICADHDLTSRGDPPLTPEEIENERLSEDQIRTAVERATELGFQEFSADRAPNAKYALEAYFERQGYLNMAEAGATTERRRFERLSDRDEVPHGSSHNRTIKKIADPDSQLTFEEFVDGTRRKYWERIRDECLAAFHAGVENILAEINAQDKRGFREPLKVAIDITNWPFHVSPYLSAQTVRDIQEENSEFEPIVYETDSGHTRYIDPEYPELVSGLKDGDQHGYQFATITIIAENTPIVIGIEPVRDARSWEDPEDIHRTSRGDIVARLLDQAAHHVDINKVFVDRGFDSTEVRHEINDRGYYYVVGKTNWSAEIEEDAKEIIEDPVYDSRLVQGSVTHNGETHEITYIIRPKEGTDAPPPPAGELDLEDYAVHTVNATVGANRAEALANEYKQRMEIENQYLSIKNNYLPTTASKDYRNRFLYFVIGVTLYNVWRITNFLVRNEVDAHLGESPPILAGEIVELVGFCLFDPGG